MWVPRTEPLPPPLISLCGEGQSGDRRARPKPPLPRLGGFFLGSSGPGSKIVLCKFQYLYAGVAVRMNARNHCQIMHVALVFLNPEPFLKEKAKTRRRVCIKQKNNPWLWSPEVGWAAADLEGDGGEGPGPGVKVLGSRLPPNGKEPLSKSLPFLGPQFPHLQKRRKARGLTVLGGPTELQVRLTLLAQHGSVGTGRTPGPSPCPLDSPVSLSVATSFLFQ